MSGSEREEQLAGLQARLEVLEEVENAFPRLGEYFQVVTESADPDAASSDLHAQLGLSKHAAAWFLDMQVRMASERGRDLLRGAIQSVRHEIAALR